jgi:hypothetical protein
MEPTVVSPPTMPSTLQVTAVSEVPVTIAAYCADVSSVTFVAPLKVRVMSEPLPGVLVGATRVTARLCETDGAAALVAVIVTAEDDAALAGAV